MKAQDFTIEVHNKMQLKHDPSGGHTRGYGLFAMQEFRKSFFQWGDGSIWEGIGGPTGGTHYEKVGENMTEVEYDDYIHRSGYTRPEGASKIRQRPHLYSGENERMGNGGRVPRKDDIRQADEGRAGSVAILSPARQKTEGPGQPEQVRS